MSKLPDPRAALRRDIQTGLGDIQAKKGQWLYATFRAKELLPNSDVENVLFMNVDATAGRFARLANHGVAFEFNPSQPSTTPGVGSFTHSSIYEMSDPERDSGVWSDGAKLAEFVSIPVPSLAYATRCASVWWDLVHGEVDVWVPKSHPETFAVHLKLHVPFGHLVNLAKHLKVAMDAAVLCLCHESGMSAPEGIRAFAEAVRQPEPEVRERMLDSSRSVFGAVRMVDRRGQAQPPDSGCVLGSLALDPGDWPVWMLSGRVVRVHLNRP